MSEMPGEKRLHITYLCNEYPPAPHGGIGSFTQMMARGVVKAGHRASVVGLYPDGVSGEETDCGVRVLRIARARTAGLRACVNGFRLRRALRALHRTEPIDVLEGQENAFALLPKAFGPVKVIRMHGGHHFFSVTLGRKPAIWRGWQERRSFRVADRVCGVSRFVVTLTAELLGLDAGTIRVLPNPVDSGTFSPQPFVQPEEGLIVFTGTVCEKKGIRQLIEAMPLVVSRLPQARLEVYGRDARDPATGKSFTSLLRGMLTPQVAERVQFKGYVPRATLPGILARAAVCVYPSHMEAMPVAWLEGLAMGRPVVASAAGPGPEMIEDGVSGLLCDPHDPSSIAECLLRVLTSRELQARLGEAGRRRVEEWYSLDALVARNVAFYRECLKNGTRP